MKLTVLMLLLKIILLIMLMVVLIMLIIGIRMLIIVVIIYIIATTLGGLKHIRHRACAYGVLGPLRVSATSLPLVLLLNYS